MIKAGTVTSFVRSWLARRPAVRVLHAFDRACNLINDQGEIVSLVTAELGPGPFAVVLPPATPPIFWQRVTAATPVAVDSRRIKVGELVVDTAPAVDWLPRPAWEQWQRQASALALWLSILTTLRQGGQLATNNETTLVYRRHFAAGSKRLLSGLAAGDTNACQEGAQQLAGLGPGLTPAGDDFLVGAIYGLWATRPADAAQSWGHVIAETAAPRTTLLSAAWLRAAARGEAAEAWHELVRAGGKWGVGSGESGCQGIAAAVGRVLNTGHSSGADALAGFEAVLEARYETLPAR